MKNPGRGSSGVRSLSLGVGLLGRGVLGLGLLGLGLLGLLFVACSPAPGPQTGSESHFVLSCDDGCGELQCLCGICTRLCSVGDACEEFGARAQCVNVGERSADSMCPGVEAAAFCDLPCVEDTQCAAAGAGFFCRQGYCREDALATPNEPFPGFGTLCAQLECSTQTAPPRLAGTYVGSGQVSLSSSPLWRVGDSESVTVTLTEAGDGILSGTVDMASLDLAVIGAVVRGEGGGFTIYVSDGVDLDGCLLEARVVIAGVAAAAVTPATLSGELALRFTGNVEGAACTAEQRDEYPSTGANFTYEVTAALP